MQSASSAPDTGARVCKNIQIEEKISTEYQRYLLITFFSTSFLFQQRKGKEGNEREGGNLF
jgi:hypothetical protein